MNKNDLVEWARPYLGDKRWFYPLLERQPEGHFSIIGSQKALQLAALCLSRDPKARPLMSEVVEVLTPLPEMKDMASSSSWYFQALQAERAAAAANARTGSRSGARFSRNAQPNRSLSALNGARHINSSINNGPLMTSQIEASLHRMVLMAPHIKSTIDNGPLLHSQKEASPH